MNIPNLTLKVIVSVHFILSVWGTMSSFLPLTYTYVHIGLLLCGLWAIGAPESTDAIVMTLVTLCFSVLQDIILLALYEPRGYADNEGDDILPSKRNEYRFALGMSILNLILKPFSAFILLRLFQTRSSNTTFHIPVIDRIPGLGGLGTGGYEDLDSSRPPPPAGMPVETASHHATVTNE